MNKSKNEQWRSIKEFENYLVSNKGRIMNGKTGRILRPASDRYGYEKVNLYNNGKSKPLRVHRLVAQAFIDNPNDHETINHIDENKHNNCVENLEWMSVGDNIRYSQAKPVEQYDLESGRLICTYSSLSDCCKMTGFDQSAISRACRGMYKRAYNYIWKYADNNVFIDENYE